MNIAIFHYHLNRGGVTDVIVYSVQALLAWRKDIEEIRLVTGEQEGADETLERLKHSLDPSAASKIRLDILEGIAYVETGTAPERLQPDSEALTGRLLARYGEDTLWWVHNYHLGKNPVFTRTILNVARTGSRKLLLQIHDFPECGRHDNMKRLVQELGESPYVTGPNVRYAVINERDKSILSDAGLGESVHLLVNPVSLAPLQTVNTAETRTKLAELATPFYHKEGPILLYPVRAIRRKNIFEAALFAILMDPPANLVVTLPGESRQEQPYSDLVHKAYQEMLIPGVWCPELSGQKELSYSALAASCHAVISTSVQEGFGYSYINSLHWQKPLLSRYLDVLSGILPVFGSYPRRFWADFRIPADPEMTSRIQNRYNQKIDSIADAVPERALKSMRTAVRKLAAGGGIDVSFLPAEDQYAMLEHAKDPTWLAQTRALNKDLLESASRTIQAIPPNMDSVLEQHFGYRSFARNFAKIIPDFGIKRKTPGSHDIQLSVLKSFGRLDYLRLLYDY